MQLKKSTQLATAISILLVSTPLWATNGYFTHGIGTKNKGMAGSGLAMPEDAISVANNPAAALANAGKYDIGIAVFSPRRHYESSESLANGQGGAFTIGPNNIHSDNNYFYIPHMAGAWEINDVSAWSATFYGKGGMNSTWNGGTATFDPDGGMGPAPVTTFPGTYGGGISGNNGAASVDFSQAYLEAGYARSAGDSFTWGVSLVGVMQVFAARGLAAFAGFTETFAESIVSGGGPVPVNNLTNNGHDKSYGIGGKFGFQWEMTETVSFAASYQTKINTGRFDKYSDLFAENGGFDIPPDLKLGITYRPSESLALNFDVEQIWYGDIDSIANPVRNVYACPTAGAGGTDLSSCFGGNNGGGFGWEDMTVYKIGAQWSSSDVMTWRAGYSHGDQPIPDNEVMFNILAPATIEDHITVGFTRGLPSGNEWSLSFMYAPNNKVTGPATFTNPMESGNPFDPTQEVSIDMNQWELEFGFGWR
jgi:long-chain fatty acid transport protein